MTDRRVQLAVAMVQARTAAHRAAGDKRCGCGQCAHWVLVAARRAGISRERLEAALPPRATAEPRPKRRPRPHGMRTRICESGTIRLRGGDHTEAAGIRALLDRMYHEDQ
ncbi:hypothetical protein [Gordonia sp. VNK21]|uniref:hypothetical protein n=1 Tax=Gordonia sp. VNK21 TaxID=3382483 RepID=UPI0038D43D15